MGCVSRKGCRSAAAAILMGCGLRAARVRQGEPCEHALVQVARWRSGVRSWRDPRGAPYAPSHRDYSVRRMPDRAKATKFQGYLCPSLAVHATPSHPFLPPGRRRRRQRRAPHAHRARLAARGRPLHRHQGRLQRRRLRRLHRGDRRTGRTPARRRAPSAACAADRQRLHPVPAHAARQGAVHGRRPQGAVRPRPTRAHEKPRCAAAPGAAGAGRLPRLAVRLLHAGLRDVAVVDLRAPPRRRHAADAPAAGRRPVGQPVPLHRLPADPRRGPAHVRPAGDRARHGARGRGAAAHRCSAKAPSSYAAPDPAQRTDHFHAPRTLAELAALREQHAQAPSCWPAPPTSACGSTSSSATWATSSTSATSAR